MQFLFQYLLLLLFCFTLVHAEDSIDDPAIPEIIVTATRTTQTIEDTLASVTLFTREQIIQSGAITLPQLLRQVPGLDMVGGGGFGKVASIFMRGTESDHVLVLIDGVKIGSATLGGTSLQDIPLAQIERIEIVRGPRSSLYGSEAIGGVIQIFTRSEAQEPHFSVNLGGGNQHTYQVNSRFSGQKDQLNYAMTAGHLRTEGFNSCEGSFTESAGCFTVEPDQDGYHNTAVTAQLGYQWSEDNHFAIHGFHTQGQNEFDAAFGGNETDFTQQVLGIKLSLMITEQWESWFNLSHYRDDQKNFGNTAQENDFNTKRIGFSWQNNLTLPNHQLLTINYDYQNDKVASTTDYRVKSRYNHGLLAEYQITFDQFTFLTGIRGDDNEQFGNNITTHLSLGYLIAPAWRMFMSYGTAFKAPTFNDLYFPDFGNPQIQPEKSKSWEIGTTITRSGYQGSLSIYRTLLDNMIGFDEQFNVVNIDQAEIIGLDGTLTWHIAAWEMATQFSWLKPEDRHQQRLLPRRAEKTGRYSISRYWQKLKLGADFLTQSHRFDDRENQHRLAGYGLLNVYGEYPLTPRLQLRISIENALNKDYETIRFYNMPSRTFLINGTFNFR